MTDRRKPLPRRILLPRPGGRRETDPEPHRLTDGQAADYNQALAAVLEAYDLLAEVVIMTPAPPLRGWNARQQINDIYDRLWYALEKLAAVAPEVVAKARRQRISDPTRGVSTPRAGWSRL